MTAPIDDEFTELVDATIPRVDLVDKAANGMTFLIAKAADGAGLMDPDLIRDLIGKAEHTTDDDSREMVTMSGSPAAIAKLIHEAAQRPADPVTKDGGADLDVTEPLADAEVDAPGMESTPGSPAWEAVDAATARKWTAILARAKAAVDLLADREMLEAAAGDDGDAMQAMDLQDACCAIDYAISILAPFAVAEQAEAELADELSAIGKSLDGFDPAALETIETLGVVRKAGRVLSAANEAAIRGAVESLQKVLASLPAAPTADEESGRPVAKTQEDTVTEAVEPQEPTVAKADGEGKPSMRAVYDARGRLVGIVDPADITPIEDADAAPDEAAAEQPPAAEPAGDDMEPAPAAEVGTPADAPPVEDDGVAKSQNSQQDDEVLKGIAATAAKELLDQHAAGQQEVIAKQAETIAALTETVETLKGQVKALEEQPAAPKVFTNGAVPPAHMLRGQDRGAPAIDVAKAQEMKKGLYGGDAAEQKRTAEEMQRMAIERLHQIRGA